MSHNILSLVLDRWDKRDSLTIRVIEDYLDISRHHTRSRTERQGREGNEGDRMRLEVMCWQYLSNCDCECLVYFEFLWLFFHAYDCTSGRIILIPSPIHPSGYAYVPFVQEVLSVLLTERSKLGTQQNELDSIEVVTLPAAVPPHYYIMLWTERLDIALTPKWSESRDDHLLDVHGSHKCWRSNYSWCGPNSDSRTAKGSADRCESRHNHRSFSLSDWDGLIWYF